MLCGIEKKLLALWAASRAFLRQLDDLDKIKATTEQRAAINSAQAEYRWFQGANLGELLNLFHLPPESRH